MILTDKPIRPINHRPRHKRVIWPKHQQVIDEYFKNGFNQIEACRTLGYKNPQSSAAHIFTDSAIRHQIYRRKNKAMQRADLTAEWFIGQLLRKAMAPQIMAKYLKTGEDGNVYTDFTDITEEDRALLDWKAKNTKAGENHSQEMQVALTDSNRALEQLMKIAGIGKEDINITNKVEVKLDDKELARRLAFILNSNTEEA